MGKKIQNESNSFDSFIFCLHYKKEYGSGVCFQTREGEYLVITAAHCILGKELQEEKIEFEQIEFFRQRNGQIESVLAQIKDGFFSKEKDLCILVIQTDEFINSPILGDSAIGNEVEIYGFPKALANKESKYPRVKLNGKINEIPEWGVIQLRMYENVETNLAEAKDVVGGMSGAGIFICKQEQIYLVGIVTDLSSPDGAFNGVIGISADMIQMLLEENGYDVKSGKGQTVVEFGNNKQERWNYYEISDVIISQVQDGERSYSYDECMEWLIKEDIPYIQILGEGGTGKTTFLIKAEKYLQEILHQKVCYIWLNDLNISLQEKLSIDFDKETLEKEQIILLLDGFNEIEEERRKGLALQIKELYKKYFVQIIFASRRKVDGTAGVYGVKALYTEKLYDEQIRVYLQENGADLQQAVKVWELLRNPMMLTVYTQTCKELRDNRDLEYFRFYDEVHNRGGLIANYLESLAAKQYMQYIGKKEEMRELVMDLYMAHFLLPSIAAYMESEKLFVIYQDVLFDLVCEVQQKLLVDWDFIGLWFERREISEYEFLKELNELKIIKYLRSFPTVFYGDKEWKFTHHNFRDGLAAMNFIRICEVAVWKKQIPSIFYAKLSEDLVEFVSELLHCNHGNSKEVLLNTVMNLFRGQNAELIKIPLYNILQIKKSVEGNLAGNDFSGLDLKGQILEPYIDGNCGVIKTDFRNAIIYPENLIPNGHESIVEYAGFSPDGKFVVTVGSDGAVCLWNAYTVQLERKFIMPNTGFCVNAEFSEDGRLLAVAVFETIYVWDIESGEELHCFDITERFINKMCFHPSGMELAVFDETGCFLIIDVRTGNEIWKLSFGDNKDELEGGSGNFCYSPDGNKIIIACDKMGIQLWNREQRHCIWSNAIPDLVIKDIQISHNGEVFAISFDNNAYLYEVETGKKLLELSGHDKVIFRVDFSPNDRMLATASADNTARIWNMENGECMHILQGHTDCVQKAFFRPSGEWLATAGCDGLIGIWDVEKGCLVHRLERHKDIVTYIAFSPDGEQLVSVSLDENICIWNVSTGKLGNILKNNGRRIDKLHQINEKLILTSDYPERTLRIWDIEGKICIWEKADASYEIAFCPESALYAEQTDEKVLFVEDALSHCVLGTSKLDDYVKNIRWSFDGQYILTRMYSDSLLLINAKSGDIVVTFPEKYSRGKFSPNGKYLVCEGVGCFGIWDCEKQQMIKEYTSNAQHFVNYSFSEDCKYLILQSNQSVDCFIDMDLRKDEIIIPEDGDFEIIYPNGIETRFLFAVDNEGICRMWDYATGKIRKKIKLHEGKILCVEWNERKQIAAILYRDKTLIILDTCLGKILAEHILERDNVWKMKWGNSADVLFLVENAIVYRFVWKENSYEVLIDQRYDERLKGCRLQNARFDASMRNEDIRLLKKYG